MQLLMERCVVIGGRLVRVWKIFVFSRIDWTAAEWLSGKTVVKISGNQELSCLRIAHKDALLVIGLSVPQIISKVRVARGGIFIKRTPETVNKVVRVDRIAVGPASILTQVKDELRRVVVDMPAFGECRIGSERFGVVLDETFVKGHVKSRFWLAVADYGIE